MIDSHCHLDFPEFAADLPGVIARAGAAGVTGMLTIATRVARTEAYRAIAQVHAEVWHTVGTHPHGAAEEPDIPPETIADLARKSPRCVGIGEAGLDYHYADAAPEAVQERVLRAHIEAARLSALPLVIHARDADEHMERVLCEEMARKPFRAVLHCFSSGARLAQAGVELGLYVSFSGIVTFRRSHALRDIARAVPLDRILVETDAPFLAPEPHRGRTNEPAYTADTARSLSNTLGLTPEELDRTTTENFFRLFDRARA